MLTDSPVVELHILSNTLSSTLVTARRPRDMDVAALLRTAERYAHEQRGVHLNLWAAESLEDAGRVPEACAAMAAAEAIYDSCGVELSAPLHTVFVLNHACNHHDAAAARLWWERMKTKKIEHQNSGYWLARTALLWVEGRLAEAEEAWQKANAKVKKLPEFGGYALDRARCAQLRQALDQASGVVERTREPRLEVPSAAAAPAFALPTHA